MPALEAEQQDEGLQQLEQEAASQLLRTPPDGQDSAEDEIAPSPEPVLDKFDFSKLSYREKARFFYDNITVEPMLGAYVLSWELASMATQNLNLEKACRVNLHYSVEVCDALTRRDTANYTFEEEQVQQLTAGMAGLKAFLQNCLPAVIVLFVGAWSDRHGRRKPCMLLPIAGEIMTCIAFLVCTFFFYELPVEAAVLSEAIFPAMCGGWVTMFMGVFSYIADVTSEDTRTLRIGIVNLLYCLGIPVGVALSGVLYKLIGFYGVFSLSGCLHLYGLWYGYKYVKETPKVTKGSGKGGILAFVKDFFNVSVPMEVFRVSLGNRQRRVKVIIILMVVMMIMGPMMGEFTVTYLFFRLKFNWEEVQYSMYLMYSTIVNLAGSTISVGLLSHRLKIDDSIIGILSCTSKILAGFMYAFATTAWMIYLAPIVDMVNGTSFIAVRSITSKLVPTDELGKVNSLVGACEAVVPLLFGPLYSQIYQATMHTLPGAFYLVGGAITAPAILGFMCLYGFSKKEKKKEKKTQQTAVPSKEEVETEFHNPSQAIMK